jgi:16S rRNA G527 N7-methylase RsmG
LVADSLRLQNKGEAQLQTIRTPEAFAAAFGAPREAVERLVLYEKLLRQWQKAMNLVAPATLDAVWHRHFADSAQLVPLAPPQTRSWIDLGSGAGFPGLVAAIMLAPAHRRPPPPRATPFSPQAPIARREDRGEGQERAPTPMGHDSSGNHFLGPKSEPLAGPHPGPLPPSGDREHVARPEIRFTLIESDTRKCAFLREVARQTGVAVDILSRRAESARTSVNKDLPRIVSARALAPLDRLLDLAEPLSPPGTTLLFPKGREVAQELQMAESRWRFQVALVPSVTDTHGRIAVITNLERKAKD